MKNAIVSIRLLWLDFFTRQLLRIMKLTGILLLAVLFQLSARGLGQTVTLSVKDAPLQKVITEITRQSGVSIIYDEALIKNAQPVTVSVNNVRVEEVMELVLSGQPFHFILEGKKITISTAVELSPRLEIPLPPITISGRVVEENGQPLAGVSIVIKGLKGGGFTGDDGRFSVVVPNAKVTLVFSIIGYADQQVVLDGNRVINISLMKTDVELSDVAVIGYGKSSRKNLSSAVTSLKQNDLNRGAITDVGQLLQGKVAGLNITASGDPNRPAAIVMRGASTLNSSQSPFFVIDGVPGADISTIAPDDIESIDVLKDAAATAIYGNRAANGVIMITSKKGKKNQLQLSYNGYTGIEKVSSKIDMMNSAQLREFLTDNGLSSLPDDDKGADTDWQSSIQKKSANSFSHNLSIIGGGANSSYSASINYAKKDGIIIGSDLTRIIARLSLNQYMLNDKVKLGVTLTNAQDEFNNVPNRNFALLQSVNHLPFSPVTNLDGSYFENFNTTGYFNPYAIIKEAQDNTKSNNLIAGFTAQVDLPFNLKYDLVISYQKYSNIHGEYYSSYYTNYNSGSFYNNPDPPVQHTPMNFGINGSAFRSSYENTNKTLETFITWDKNWNSHSVKAMLGYSWQNNVSGDGFQTTSTNFTVDNLGYNNLALSNPYGVPSYRINFGRGTDFQETRLISDFGRLNYNYNDKYHLQASLRRDGSSVFGENNSWGYFPAVGAMWRIGRENFMQSQEVFNDLKVRASYGVTGNATGFDAYTARFISGVLGSYYYDGALVNAYGPVQSANPNLQWEKTITTNLGLDFVILKGALSGTIDLYNKRTNGMIYEYDANPVIVPTGSIIANGGSMNNKGIELGLMATPVKSKTIVWNIGLNLSHNKNEIISLSTPEFSGGDSITITSPGGQGQTGSSLQILKSGKPIGQFFTFQYAGKNEEGASQFIDSKGALTTTPQIGVDYHYIGSPHPDMLLGFSNTVRYKRLELNVFFRGTFGNKIFNVTRADLFRPATAQNYNLPVDAANESTNDQRAFFYSSRYIENGSYLRLDNATLSYNFEKVSRHIKSLRVYTTVNNLFVITNYKGIDPEINQSGIAPGIDANNFYPKTRTFLFGVNLSF